MPTYIRDDAKVEFVYTEFLKLIDDGNTDQAFAIFNGLEIEDERLEILAQLGREFLGSLSRDRAHKSELTTAIALMCDLTLVQSLAHAFANAYVHAHTFAHVYGRTLENAQTLDRVLGHNNTPASARLAFVLRALENPKTAVAINAVLESLLELK